MPDFDARLMLDCYLYDYFMKKNMPELAETFLKEANLKIDPNVALAIDVPEGFLLEWWKGSYDYASFRDWLNQRERPSKESTQEYNISHSEMNNYSLVDYASANMSNGSLSPALQEKGKAPLAFSPSTNEQGLPTSSLGKCTPTICGSTINKGSIEKGDDSTFEAIMIDDDDDSNGTSDFTGNMARLSTISEVPTVHQSDFNDGK